MSIALLNKEENALIRLLRSMPAKMKKNFMETVAKTEAEIEDMEDARLADERLSDVRNGKTKVHKWEDVKKQLNV